MQIEGPIVHPLPSESVGVTERKFWLVQPWVIVALCFALMLALSIPGLFMELTRGF
jgi:hypothetical protein